MPCRTRFNSTFISGHFDDEQYYLDHKCRSDPQIFSESLLHNFRLCMPCMDKKVTTNFSSERELSFTAAAWPAGHIAFYHTRYSQKFAVLRTT